MKKLFLITALLCCFSFAKAQDATLKETTDWLTAKLKTSVIGNEHEGWAQQTISFDGCICKVEIRWWHRTEIHISKSEFNLKDIPLSSIVKSHWEEGIFKVVPNVIKIKTINNAELINEIYVSSNEGWEDAEKKLKEGKYRNVYYVTILLELDESLTFDRISKALKHAIKLCGGTEEKF